MKQTLIMACAAIAITLFSTEAFSQLYVPGGTVGTTIAPGGGAPHPSAIGVGTNAPFGLIDIHKGSLNFTSNPASIGSSTNNFIFVHQYWLANGSLILSKYDKSLMPAPGPIYTDAIWEFANNGDFKCKGKIWATEVEVRVFPFPDYVFDDNYEMASLKELGDYIKANKHLPNMPTAAEVEQNGIGVGELQRKLVEKIEELTLYIIDLNEKNEQLTKEIANLK